MALFPRVPQSDFGSLFRLLDDWESHRTNNAVAGAGGGGGAGGGAPGAMTSFSPRFDVREDRDAYLLDGELPGIEQKDINIEFTDPHTLVINGRTDRSYVSGSPSQSQSQAGRTMGRVMGEEDTAASTTPTPTTTTATATATGKKGGTEGGGGGGGEHRYWVSERSVGEFQRSFSFPTRVNQDTVKASLKHGVLSVKVPKAAAPTSKRISVE